MKHPLATAGGRYRARAEHARDRHLRQRGFAEYVSRRTLLVNAASAGFAPCLRAQVLHEAVAESAYALSVIGRGGKRP